MNTYRLRPIIAQDEALILEARNSDVVRPFMLSQVIIAPQAHAKWMAAKLIDTHAPYYLFFYGSSPIGVAGITHYTPETKSGEWGFYVFAESAPKGAGTVMLAAFLDVVFSKGLSQVTALVFEHNVKSLKLHEKFGFTRKSVLAGYADGGDVTVWQLSRVCWQQKRAAFVAMIETVTVE